MPDTVTAATAKFESLYPLISHQFRLDRILVPTDFSKQSTMALKEAITIAECFGSELLLAHAITLTVCSTGLASIPAETFDIELEAAKSQMAAWVDSEAALKKVRHREFVAYVSAVDLVRKIAAENQVDLVIAGSHGASGLEKLALGSVAESFLDMLPCPVMIIGPHCHEQMNPFRSILFATNLDTTGLRSAQFAGAFAEQFNARLTLLHVVEKRSRRFGVQPELAEDNVRDELRKLIPTDLNTSLRTTVRVLYGNAGEVIPDIARSLCASLMITGFGNHSSLADRSPWSTLSQVIRESPCPVLCVRRHFT